MVSRLFSERKIVRPFRVRARVRIRVSFRVEGRGFSLGAMVLEP